MSTQQPKFEKITDLLPIFKCRGVLDTLNVLNDFPSWKQKRFFDELKKSSYYNAYLRKRGLMQDLGLIKYDLDVDNDKTISITRKGKDVVAHLILLKNTLNL